ncbi:MAG: hypothetical protein K0R06_675 [Clostridium sp.]|jgi:hypothetical protein|nr:hypothetical protein [Clostridium sp.]
MLINKERDLFANQKEIIPMNYFKFYIGVTSFFIIVYFS